MEDFTEELQRFSEDAVGKAIRFLDPMRRYHRMEFRGFDRVPDGPALIVGNHNGGTSPVDGLFLIHYYRTRGLSQRVYILAHDMVFRSRRVARLLNSIGIVRASVVQAELALRAGYKVLVFPGGDRESLRSFKERKKIRLAGHSGFARTAIQSDVPIVPLVSAGTHETLVVLNEGKRIARFLKLDKMFRVNVMPTVIAMPWGLVWGPGAGLPYFPLPAKITVEVGQPLMPQWWRSRSECVEEQREAVTEHMQHAMQEVLDRLYAKRRFPVLG